MKRPAARSSHFAHRQLETLTLDREVMHLRDSLIPRYSELVYYGFWFAPEREFLQAAVEESQKYVTGTVRLKLYKGNLIVAGRKSRCRSTTPTSPRWKPTRAPTTRPTRPASSGSTRCGCGRARTCSRAQKKK